MYERKLVGRTVVLIKRGVQPETTKFRGSQLIVINRPQFKGKIKNIIVKKSHDPLSLYFDDRKILFLCDYDDFPELLEHPIDKLIVTEKQVKIFLNKYQLTCERLQMADVCCTPEFFDTVIEPPAKVRAIIPTESVVSSEFESPSDLSSVRSLANYLSHEHQDIRERMLPFSNEKSPPQMYDSNLSAMSVLTAKSFSTNSVSSDSSHSFHFDHEPVTENLDPQPVTETFDYEPIHVSSVSERSLSDGSPRDNSCFESSGQNVGNDAIRAKKRKLVTSKINVSIQIQNDVDRCKWIVNEIFYHPRTNGTERYVSSTLLKSPYRNEKSDPTIDHMCTEVENTHSLTDGDPIVCVQRDGNLFVVSGSRRVFACKKANLAQIQFIENLLRYLNLTPQSVSNWSSVQLKTVFTPVFKEMSRAYLFLQIFLMDPLFEIVRKKVENGADYKILVLKDLLSKYKKDPKSTIKCLRNCEESMDDKEIRKKLSLLTACSRHLLQRKGVPVEVVNDVMLSFGSEPSFTSFVKSADMRRKIHSVEIIQHQYEEYKANQLHKQIPRTTSISVQNDFTEWSSMLTTDTVFFQTEANRRESMNGILMGHHIEMASPHYLLLPETLAKPDTTGTLHNFMEISIFQKKNGCIQGVPDFFELSNVSRKSIYTIAEFSRVVVYCDDIFVDLSTSLELKIASAFLVDVPSVIVKTPAIGMELKRRLDKTSRHCSDELISSASGSSSSSST